MGEWERSSRPCILYSRCGAAGLGTSQVTVLSVQIISKLKKAHGYSTQGYVKAKGYTANTLNNPPSHSLTVLGAKTRPAKNAGPRHAAGGAG